MPFAAFFVAVLLLLCIPDGSRKLAVCLLLGDGVAHARLPERLLGVGVAHAALERVGLGGHLRSGRCRHL